MALHVSSAGGRGCPPPRGLGPLSTYYGTTLQQQVPPELLARVSALSIFPAYGVGVIGYAVDGPLAAGFRACRRSSAWGPSTGC